MLTKQELIDYRNAKIKVESDQQVEQRFRNLISEIEYELSDPKCDDKWEKEINIEDLILNYLGVNIVFRNYYDLIQDFLEEPLPDHQDISQKVSLLKNYLAERGFLIENCDDQNLKKLIRKNGKLFFGFRIS